MLGIYKITNLINNKIYIGKSSSIESRWDYHKTEYLNKKEYNKSLYCAFRKYGLENFKFEIIEPMNLEYYNKFSDNREQYWIIFYDSLNNGYNETPGGDGGFNQKAIESNRKLSIDDVKIIREMYNKCNICLSDAYEFYKDKISKRGFQAVWLGQNYKNINPEVFSEENKKAHSLIEHQRQGRLRKNNTI